ncbi:MAG: phage tail protein [Gaiellaceae bacterium MAG52_C11]|nr:phage tail protein [Candidatus Gaiellasilicea maunaloa]
MPTQRDNPYANFNFVVEIDGVEVGAFSEVALPEATIEAIEYREGADPTSGARKLPGRVSYANVVLERGLSGRTDLWEWFKATRDGTLQRRNVAIVLLDEARKPVQRWLLRDAWPARLAYSRLEGRGNEVVIETLELAYESFETE